MSYINEANFLLLLNVFTVELSEIHKAGAGRSCRVARRIFPLQNNTIKDVNGQSDAVDVSPSTIYTPINQNQYPSLSLDGINCISIAPSSIIDI